MGKSSRGPAILREAEALAAEPRQGPVTLGFCRSSWALGLERQQEFLHKQPPCQPATSQRGGHVPQSLSLCFQERMCFKTCISHSTT